MSTIISQEELNNQILGLANTISTTGLWTGAYTTYTDAGLTTSAIKATIPKGASKKEQKEIVEQTCITFTELLLSITPFKAKEFVEKNCNRVRRAIMKKLNEVEDEQDT